MIVFRSLIMIWFLYELRTTMLYEHNTQKLNFLLHFGASSLVWFIYLPILALIALHVSALWRFKLLLGEWLCVNGVFVDSLFYRFRYYLFRWLFCLLCDGSPVVAHTIRAVFPVERALVGRSGRTGWIQRSPAHC